MKLRIAFSRPVLGIAVAAIICLCAEGLAPRLSGLLAKPACRVLAGLSYSMYLMQFVGRRLVEIPYLQAIAVQLAGAPLWLVALAAYCGVALIILATAPVAFLNYALVERPGILLGKRCVDCFARLGGRTENRAPAGGSKQPARQEEKEQQEQPDLEASSDGASAEVSTVESDGHSLDGEASLEEEVAVSSTVAVRSSAARSDIAGAGIEGCTA